MKITNFGPDGLPIALGGWSTGIVSLNSNVEIVGGGPSALNFVQRITSNTSNTLLNPIVNFAAGSNIALSAQSNTITITGAAGGGGGAPATISAGSNSTRVSEVSGAGASTTLWSPFDHAHDGIGTITASSSNTMQRGTFNLRAGTGIVFGLTDGDGDGELDTATIIGTGSSSGPVDVGVPIIIGDGTSAMATGSKGFIEIPFACTVLSNRLAADVSGSVVVDVKKATYAGLFATASICAAAKPTLSTAQKSQDTTLTGWTTAIAAGDWLEINVDSVTTIKRVTLSLTVRRT